MFAYVIISNRAAFSRNHPQRFVCGFYGGIAINMLTWTLTSTHHPVHYKPEHMLCYVCVICFQSSHTSTHATCICLCQLVCPTLKIMCKTIRLSIHKSSLASSTSCLVASSLVSYQTSSVCVCCLATDAEMSYVRCFAFYFQLAILRHITIPIDHCLVFFSKGISSSERSADWVIFRLLLMFMKSLVQRPASCFCSLRRGHIIDEWFSRMGWFMVRFRVMSAAHHPSTVMWWRTCSGSKQTNYRLKSRTPL